MTYYECGSWLVRHVNAPPHVGDGQAVGNKHHVGRVTGVVRDKRGSAGAPDGSA